MAQFHGFALCFLGLAATVTLPAGAAELEPTFASAGSTSLASISNDPELDQIVVRASRITELQQKNQALDEARDKVLLPSAGQEHATRQGAAADPRGFLRFGDQ